MGKKVVLTEDSDTQFALLHACFARADFEVVRARNGEEALAVIPSERPDVVVMDVLMPGMDGFEVCRRLKADETTKDIPVVMLSMVGGPERARVAGATDYMSKQDLDPGALVERCRELAGGNE